MEVVSYTTGVLMFQGHLSLPRTW